MTATNSFTKNTPELTLL